MLAQTVPGVQTLWRHDCAYNSCPPRWSKFAVASDEQADVEAKAKAEPIVHRHVYDKNNKKWTTKSFTVNSDDMRHHLSKALASYQDFDPDLENWTFEPPFKPIVHRWDRLKAMLEQLTEDKAGGRAGGPGSDMEVDEDEDKGDEDADDNEDQDCDESENKNDALKHLMAFLTPLVAASVEALLETRRTKKIAFESIWQIFPPGELAIFSAYGAEAAARVTKYERIPGPTQCDPARWAIDLEYVDWNGASCGLAATKTTIWEYKGFVRTTGLAVYPLAFAADPDALRAKMVARGARFEALRGFHFKTCAGYKILMDNRQRPVSQSSFSLPFSWMMRNKNDDEQL